ncbi:uncharacterized protein J8A68_003546 [[Candida] subhashii]|uniref:Pyridoxamine 5'-phosphate oxidase Alr4036 family FMN-binding domain-containing protein n=1 Tax=[Candida] subhashii TaxID=561895 RepID=A0A8J5QVC6_9ASCO|nr:uncharacterized protein J8A68_003546 [[Candida] subhashii]KAG7662920.1 hypothetical protein J8A68_003546 [[Candida] subhashii]
MLQCNYQAPWVSSFNYCIDRELAASDNKQPFITFQLATIDNETGFPHNRTLVYRGWLFNNKSSNVITFTTDKRMNKYRELLANDKFEAVFYFSHIKKQFRFRGKARIISDEYLPIIDLDALSLCQFMQDTDSIMTTATDQQSQSQQSHQQEEEEEEEVIVPTPRQEEPIMNHTKTNGNGVQHIEVQKQPISSPILSPSIASYSIIDDYTSIEFVPPTEDEWHEEIERQWNQLSKQLKKSFRKPSPKQPITDANAKLISSINRGVDGKKDEAGLKNFAVVGLFVDYVDFYELDKDRRYIYENDEYHQWLEQEVCP